MMLVASALFGTWLALVAYMVYDGRARYGPRTPGSVRWRREAPLRDAEQAQREILQALTPDDLAWLADRGWMPPTGLSGLPLIRVPRP